MTIIDSKIAFLPPFGRQPRRTLQRQKTRRNDFSRSFIYFSLFLGLAVVKTVLNQVHFLPHRLTVRLALLSSDLKTGITMSMELRDY